MLGAPPQRRVLVAADERELALLHALFTAELLPEWVMVEAATFERARFILQLDPCDVLLLDASLYRRGDSDELNWLVERQGPPLVFLAESEAETIQGALEHGVHYWLPRELALTRPALLQAMLRQAAELGELKRQARQTSETLQDSRRQISRLVSLLWETVPAEGQAPWFSQRHMMERLQEEVARTHRHGGPLTLILGEVQAARHPPSMTGEAQQLANWAAERIRQAKRRSDVAGQYGLNGFMILLPRSDASAAIGCCHRLRTLLEQPSELVSPFAPLQVFFGIASFSAAAPSVKSLLSRAEEHLERARLGETSPVEF